MDFDRYFNTQLQAEEYANTLRFVYQTLGCDSTDIDNMEITIEEETNDKTNYKNYR
jgi:hypothetical protein